MSMTIDLAFIKQFEAEVHEAFQRQGSKVLNTVRIKMNVQGKSTTFQKVGQGMATTKARHGAIPPMNQDHTPIECLLSDFYAGDWVDKLDELKTNIDERRVIANGGAWALGRKVDEQIIGALATTTETEVTITVTSDAAVLNGLLDVVFALNANDVPDDGQRFALVSPKLWARAHRVEEFSSADWVGADGLPFKSPQGNLNPRPSFRDWMGVKWAMHTGLPGVGTSASKAFAYHRTAAAYAAGMLAPGTTDVTWHGDRAAHFVNHMMSGGACLIDARGVIKATSNDTTALPTS